LKRQIGAFSRNHNMALLIVSGSFAMIIYRYCSKLSPQLKRQIGAFGRNHNTALLIALFDVSIKARFTAVGK
jgi:hypothetical protein